MSEKVDSKTALKELTSSLQKTDNVSLLEENIHHPSIRVRLTVLNNPKTPDSVLLEAVREDNSYQTLYAVATHPNISSKTARFILSENGVSPTVSLEGEVELTAVTRPDKYSLRRREASSIAHKLLQPGGRGNRSSHTVPLSEVMLDQLFMMSDTDDSDMRRFVLSCLASRTDLSESLMMKMVEVLKDSKNELETLNAAHYFFEVAERPLKVEEALIDGTNYRAIENLIRYSKRPEIIVKAYGRVETLSMGFSSPIRSLLENKNSPAEFLLEKYVGLEINSSNRFTARLQEMLEKNLKSDGKAVKFLEAQNIDVSSFPESYVIKLTIMKAEELYKRQKG